MQYKLPLALSIAAFAIAAAPLASAQTPLLYYNFDSDPALATGSTINNTVGNDGLFNLGLGSAAFVASGVPGPSGLAISLTPADDAQGGADAPSIDTTFTVLSLGISPSTAYTAMVWANFGSVVGDNMIFGGNPAQNGAGDQILHHGSRGGNYHSGHWADDIGPDQGAVFTVPTGTGAWHHVAYTNDGPAGLQTIYVDGVQAVQGAAGTAGTMNLGANLWIATTFGSGSFSGQLDEVKVYDQLLTPAQIQAASVVVPEPSSAALLAITTVGVAALRRRRR